MAWWKRPLRILQFNIEDRRGTPLLYKNVEDMVNLAKKIRANVLVVFARDPWGRAFYDSKYHPRHPLVDPNFLRKIRELTEKEGIRLVLMVGHTADAYYFNIHTDWAQRNDAFIPLEHIPADENSSPEWPQICINSPFFDVILGEIKEVEDLADMVFLDSFRYLPDPERACLCSYCKERFKRETGKDLEDAPFWEVWDWRYNVVKEKLEKIKRSTQIPLMFNAHPGGWAGRMLRIILEAPIDFIFAEASEADHQPPGFISEMVKLSSIAGVPVAASRNYFHLYRTTQPTTSLAIRQGLRESMAAGGNIWLLVFGNEFAFNKIDDSVDVVFKEHELLEDYLTASRLRADVKILYSVTSHELLGYKFIDEMRGFYYALLHAHIPVTYTAYPDNSFLILPNAVSADTPKSSFLATFLSLTYTGRYDLQNFLLDDIELVGVLRAPWSYVRIDGKIIPLGDMSYSFKQERHESDMGHIALVKTDLTKRGEILGTTQPSGPEYTLGRSPPPPVYSTGFPAVVEGKNFAYISFQVGRHYWRTGLPFFRDLILRYVPKRLPLVSAPETVQAEYFYIDDGHAIHLINHTYNQRIVAKSIGGVKKDLPPFSSTGAVHPPREVVPLKVDILLPPGRWKIRLPLRDRGFVAEERATLTLNEYEFVLLEPTR